MQIYSNLKTKRAGLELELRDRKKRETFRRRISREEDKSVIGVDGNQIVCNHI